MSRISKDRYYLNIAKEVSSRSTCFRARHGAIILRDDQIVSTGYVGAPRKTKDCFERGNCLRDELQIPHGQRYEMCRSIHAEQNAIINAARAGVNLLGGILYLYSESKNRETGEFETIDSYPCFICKKMIVNSGIERVIVNLKNNEVKTYQVADWVDDWQNNDLLDDVEAYGEKYQVKK